MKKKDRNKSQSLGGNELPKGSKRIQVPSVWDGVKTAPSIWERNDIIRNTLGTAWGIRKTK